MSAMLKDDQIKDQKFTEVRKLQQRGALLKKIDDGDDESGGGNGKRMQNSFKLEKLLNVLAKGRLKAQSFWRFLSKEGLDANDTKKSTLGKQIEKSEKLAETAEKAKDSNGNKKNTQAIQEKTQSKEARVDTHVDKSSGAEKAAWEKARAVDDGAKQRFAFQESSPFSMDSTSHNSSAEAVRRSIMGNRVAGSVISGTTNSMGFIKQVDITGEQGKAAAQAMANAQHNQKQSSIFAKPAEQAATQQSRHAEQTQHAQHNQQNNQGQNSIFAKPAEQSTAQQSHHAEQAQNTQHNLTQNSVFSSHAVHSVAQQHNQQSKSVTDFLHNKISIPATATVFRANTESAAKIPSKTESPLLSTSAYKK